MVGYVRNDVTNQIADGNIISAAPLDGEFNAIEDAFDDATGHSHDGSAASGAPITVVGPAQDLVISGSAVLPKTDNTLDLGSSSLEFKNLWIDGTANIDSLVADTADINAGTIDNTTIGATTPAAATVSTLTATSGTVGGSAITTAANTQTLTNKTLTSPVITGGTIDGVAPATISGTQTLTNKTINLANNTLVATSAQLAAALTDETGTGALVFGTGPTISAPTISGGSITGITDLAIADGGTGASTAGGARISLGLTTDVKAYGALGNGTTNDTPAIQAAIDAVEAIGGGMVLVPSGIYSTAASTLSENYDNNGATIVATSACIILRPRVKLIGQGEVWFKPTSPALHAILPISPNGSEIRGINIDGSWTGVSGAGHGILQLQAIGSEYCRNFTVADLTVKNVASYGVGIENGDIENLLIDNVKTFNTGADGIDIKSRGPTPKATSIKLHNISVDTFGQRTSLVGQAGVDIRGDAVLTNIHVYNVGAGGIADQVGVRFRTLAAPGSGDNAANGSSLVGFFITGTGTNCTAVQTGSPNTRIMGGFCENTGDGIVLTGNVNGNAVRSQVVGVTAKDMTRGFVAQVNTENCVFSGCIADNCTTGFRNEAANTLYSGCSDFGSTTPYSETVGASGTSEISSSMFYPRFLTESGNTTDRVRLIAKSDQADADIALEPKGTGRLRYGTWTTSADVPVTGYIEIRDEGGTLRRLAVVG